MSLRGFGYQTLPGTPQPLFGTTLSAAISPSPDLWTGRLDPSSNNSQTLLPLNTPLNLFRTGDHVMVGASNSFNQGSTTPVDGGCVQQANLSASNILVTGLQRRHSAGEWVILSLPVAQINIQNGSAATLYLGEDSTVSASSPALLNNCSAQGNITIRLPA